MTTTLRLSPRRLAVLATAALAIPAAGCGSSSSSGGDATDPASAIPPSASFYLEATVRPTGQQRADVEAALGKILHTSDPGQKLEDLIDKSATHGETFAKDVKPWLGKKAAVAVTGVTAGKADYVIVINSTDDAKARKSIENDPDYKTKRSFEGVDYRVSAKDGDAEAVVKHFAIDGTEPALKQVIHLLNKGGDSLASNANLQEARKQVGGKPGFMYVDLETLFRSFAGSAGSSLTPGQLSAISGIFKRFRAFGVGISADAQAVRMNIASVGSAPTTGNGPASTLPLDKAPAGAWLAISQSKIGSSIQRILDSLKGVNAGASGASIGDAISQLETATGLKLKEDVLSWMGDANLFVEGDSLPALGGALVIQSTDPAKTRATIAKLKGLLTRFGQRPGPAPAGTSDGFSLPLGSATKLRLQIGLAGSRFVIAVGDKALRDAIHPGATLGSTATFNGASGLLGGSTKPSFYLDFRTVTRFIALAANGDPGFAKAKPYLDAFTAVIGGGSGPGKAEIAIGLR